MNGPEPASRKSARLLDALLFAILPILFVGPSLLPGRQFLPQHPAGLAPLAQEDAGRAAAAWEDANLLASDKLFPVLTDAQAMRDAVRAGSLPTWAAHSGMGMPLAAGSLASPWYPPNWLMLVMEPADAFGWLALLALFLAGLGMSSFLAARDISDAARRFGVLAYQAGGFALFNLHYGMKVDAALWLPWSLWAVEGILVGRTWARTQLFLFTALSLVAGFAPIAFFGVLFTTLYALQRSFAVALVGAPYRVAGPSGFLSAFGAIVLGVIGAGVSLVPMAEASALSLRAEQTTDVLAAQSLPNGAFGTALMPGMLGGPDDPFFAPKNPLAWLVLHPDEKDRAWHANPLEWNVHAGIACLLLALAALLAAPRRAFIPTAALLCVFGFAFGWFPFRLAHSVTGLNFGSPARVLCLAWFLWPWLGAIGMDALLSGRRAARWIPIILGAACAAIGLWLWNVIDPTSWAGRLPALLAERHDVSIEEARVYVSDDNAVRAGARLAGEARALFAFAGASVLCILITGFLRRRDSKNWQTLAVLPWLVLVGAEGMRLSNAHLAPRQVDGPLFPQSEVIAAIRSAAEDGRVLRIDESESGVEDVLCLARPNMLAGYGIDELTPYAIFTPKHVTELFARIDPQSVYRGGTSRLSRPELLGHPLLDLARVKCVLSKRPLDHPRLEEVFARESFHVYRRTGDMPLARVYAFAADATEEFVVEALATGAYDPARVLQLVKPAKKVDPDRPRPFVDPDWQPGEVIARRTAPNRLEAQVTGSGGGWLVFHDGWYPGWKATVNGVDVRIERAHSILRAVPIPAGDSIVRTKYEPWSLRYGTALTLFGLLASIAISWRGRAR